MADSAKGRMRSGSEALRSTNHRGPSVVIEGSIRVSAVAMSVFAVAPDAVSAAPSVTEGVELKSKRNSPWPAPASLRIDSMIMRKNGSCSAGAMNSL